MSTATANPFPPTAEVRETLAEILDRLTNLESVLAQGDLGAKLLYTPREAAKALSICERSLFSMTAAGIAPCSTRL